MSQQLDQPSTTRLDARFSSEGATPTPWSEAVRRLDGGRVFWITTVRADGRPHVTPLFAVWLDGAMYFATGPGEQKARNLAANPKVSLTLGSSVRGDGLDVVVEGEARRVTDEDLLRRLAQAWLEKHGEEWRFEVRDGAFYPAVDTPGNNDEAAGPAHVFEVAPTSALGFGKGDVYSQTTWRF
jgi:nitroimidazol reductase NimA-like FMN-containing flavoprotein (pyridoxamine 5'-phosphate oxidase superfamily)